MIRYFKYTLLVLLLLSAYAWAAQTEFKIISLQYRFASELISVIEPMVGEGSVSAIDNHLMIRATPERMEEIEAVITALDQPRKQYRVSIQSESETSLDANQIGAGGGVVVERSGGRTRSGGQVDVGVRNRETQTRRHSQQFLQVMEGEFAYIRVGELVAFTQQWITLSQQFVQIQQFLSFQDVTSGFAVRPRSIGNQVELEIMPRLARLNNSGVIDFEELSTTIRVTPGQWVDIGGVMSSSDEVSRAILQREQIKSIKNNMLRVKVE